MMPGLSYIALLVVIKMEVRKRLIRTEEPLRTTQLDPNFRHEVSKVHGGESIVYCFQCGKCTATCPIRRFDEVYRPREIVRAALLGLKEIVLTSDIIWLCAFCYSCTERCPQGVRLTDVIRALRNLAVKRGYVHPFFETQGRTVVKFGRIFDDETEAFINETRSGMGLPPIPPVSIGELSRVLDCTKVRRILEIGER